MTPEIAALLMEARLHGKEVNVRSITNSYGNVEGEVNPPFVRIKDNGVTNAQLAGACRTLQVPYAQYRIGFSGKRKYGFRPTFGGIVVRMDHAERIELYLNPEKLDEMRELVYANDDH